MGYDLLVVGGGAGFKVAKEASKVGWRVALVDKGPLGGTCVNRGCIPSKMLIYPADLYSKIQQSRHLNINVKDSSFCWADLVRRVKEGTEETVSKIEKAVEKWEGVSRYHEEAYFLDEQYLQVGEERISAKRIVIASGVRPLIPDIPGLAGTPYMTSTEALQCETLPKRLIIIGGGYIAAELGHLYGTAGSDVTVIVRSEMLRREDREIRDCFLSTFSKKNRVLFETSVRNVHFQDGEFSVTVHGKETEETQTLKGDGLLIATGIRPNSDLLKIKNLGVQLDKDGFIKVNKQLRASEKQNIWAFGDAIGPPLFRHTANKEANYVIDCLLGNKQDLSFEMPPVPHAIFTHPQIASVGATEEELIRIDEDYISQTVNFSEVAMGRARGAGDGIFKLLARKKDGKILGAHVCGEEACELIHLLIAYITMDCCVEDVLKMTFIHPGLHECISVAAEKLAKSYSRKKFYVL